MTATCLWCMPPMHLLIAHNEYGRPSGEEQALASIEALLVERGNRVSRFRRSSSTIGTSLLKKAGAALAGIENPAAGRHMARTLADAQPDAVLVQNLYPFLSPSILQACRAHGVPVVMRCSNYRLFCPTGLHLSGGTVCERCLGPGREVWCVLKNCEGSLAKSTGYALRNATARLGRRILDRVDVFVVLTEFQKQRFIANGIPESRLAVIPNHVAAGTSVPFAGDWVTFMGRVAPEKGIADFLALARQFPGLPFVVAGAVKDSARALLRELPANVRMLGHLDRAALGEVLGRTRVMVSCNRWFEGFPNAVLEAMAAGKPVLAADLGGMSEIVDHGQTGLLYPAGDVPAAARLLGDLHGHPARCADMGAAAHRKVATAYSADRVYAAYERVFRLARQPAIAVDTLEPDCESVAVPTA
ncbi:MAG: glycosyltransferase family 4 protein [Lentisphaerae bacterium]|nr:glycosyltransferase family 4 protein [Lentisphaerota bacterium]